MGDYRHVAKEMLSTIIVLDLACGCESTPPRLSPPPGALPILFVTQDEQRVALRETGRTTPEVGEYATWKKLHDSLVTVAEKHGRASWTPEPKPDFYFSGDWFDEYCDSFALLTTKGLSPQALRDFQVAVAAHHPRASLVLIGQAKEIEGLEIHITATQILVAWEDATSEKCRRKLERIGIRLD